MCARFGRARHADVVGGERCSRAEGRGVGGAGEGHVRVEAGPAGSGAGRLGQGPEGVGQSVSDPAVPWPPVRLRCIPCAHPDGGEEAGAGLGGWTAAWAQTSGVGTWQE